VLDPDSEVQIFDQTVFRVDLTAREPPLTIEIRLDLVTEGLHFEVKIGTSHNMFYQVHHDKKKITVTHFLSDFIYISVYPEVKPD